MKPPRRPIKIAAHFTTEQDRAIEAAALAANETAGLWLYKAALEKLEREKGKST